MRMKRACRNSVGVLLSIVAFLAAQPAGAVSIGMTDDFQDGTTQGWQAGASFTGEPTNIGTGGPDGVGDGFLQVTSFGGFGPGSRLIALNRSQWLGDFIAAGVNGLRLHVKNLGDDDLVMRLAIDGEGGQFASATGHALPESSGWQEILLPLDAAFLTAVGGADVNESLSNVSEFRILHNPSPDIRGAAVVGQFGVDNITAIAFSSGDVNRDGTVDIFDVAVVSNQWMTAGPLGDANGDGTVDIFDVAEVSNHWGEGIDDGSSVAPTPEPAAAWLALIACFGAAVVARRSGRAAFVQHSALER